MWAAANALAAANAFKTIWGLIDSNIYGTTFLAHTAAGTAVCFHFETVEGDGIEQPVDCAQRA